MATETNMERLAALGYDTSPPLHANSPGYPGVAVLLRANAARHQPASIRLRLDEGNGRAPWAHLHAAPDLEWLPIICPGRLYIHSAAEVEGTFFTFGALWRSEMTDSGTVIQIESPAPLLEMPPDSLAYTNVLVDEIEALWAREEAALGLETVPMLERMLAAGAETVYLSTLQSLQTHLATLELTPRLHSLANLVAGELDWYARSGRRGLYVPDLVSLLAKVS